MPLDEYARKRDFTRTPEPGADMARDADASTAADVPPRLRYVIQKHAASQLHYDFRLEWDGVLLSWAVPKGPSLDPADKRLAVQVEDHPLDYADFEGVIPEDEYGGGTVIVWDAGPYRNLRTDDDGNEMDMAAAHDQGTIEVWLEGRKLRGGYALVHARVGGGDENWLLVKMKDDAADARRNPVSTEPRSVLSGRTLREVAEREGDDDG